MQTVKSIPVGLAEWSLVNKRYRELHLLMLIKDHSTGIFHKCQLDALFAISEIKTRKTFDERLNKLKKMGWITLSVKTGWYKILSFLKIMELTDSLSRRTMELTNKSIKCFQEFLFAGVLTYYTNKSKYFYTKIKKGREAASNKGLGFVFFDTSLNKSRRYFGIGMETIATRLKISRQRANKLKLLAKKFGFIECFNRKRYLRIVKASECRYKKSMDFEGFVKFKKGKDKVIRAYRIMPDEIKPSIRLKRKRSISIKEDCNQLTGFFPSLSQSPYLKELKKYAGEEFGIILI